MTTVSETMCTLLRGVALGAALASVPAVADQPPTMHQIGLLAPFAFAASPYMTGLRDGLSELGYVEGKNFVIESRLSDGGIRSCARLPLSSLA